MMHTCHPFFRAFASRAFVLLLAFALVGSLSACDSSGDDGDSEGGVPEPGGADEFSLDRGSFSASVTYEGATSDVSGGSVFGVNEEEDEFTIFMLSGTKEQSFSSQHTQITITTPEPFTLAPGSYEIGSSVDGFRGSADIPDASFGGGPGSLTIERASDDEIEGSFSFTDPLRTPDEEPSAEFEGTFTAKRDDNISETVCRPNCDE